MGSNVINSVALSPVFTYDDLGGNSILKNANAITIAGWLYLNTDIATVISRIVVPY